MTSAADESSNPGLGMMAIRQEFVWDDTSGTFQTVNIYTIGYVEDIIATWSRFLLLVLLATA